MLVTDIIVDAVLCHVVFLSTSENIVLTSKCILDYQSLLYVCTSVRTDS